MQGPWLTIIGVGEDGAAGLTPAATAALSAAQVVIGPPRHMALLPETDAQRIEWPVPFADGIPHLLAHRGTPTVALTSGDPFWFGAGSVLAERLGPSEWRAFPGPSVFSLAAARLGWRIEQTVCLGLHAAPLGRLRPHLAPGQRIVATLRDGAAVADIAAYLADTGWGDSRVTALQALGGPRERVTTDLSGSFDAPVAVAIEAAGGAAIPLASGRPDATFAHDGQITKRPVRALTLSALGPCPGEHLWDIGAGSGSIALEWLMAHPSCTATAVEGRSDRATRIRENAKVLGQDRLHVVEGRAPDALDGLPAPDAIFVGGGLSQTLLDRLIGLPARLVVNAVTLESEALVLAAHATHGGSLLRAQLSQPEPLGGFHGWKHAYPITQWCRP
ncbi:precorrin-6y C5,15-methyltransferase (decarboxylating) subunit CbiE [Palleronia abyssalis]|uniref:Precorrin-6Y C(5,15)-methyltransferase [decarboxylating] n=1 Tax=Palleronia abyssalis TaxID=1501240 RepID=A0A2R8BS87_9RHOB|nr:precorrin-6y C5,15-methyltransferase (decarboxylating) subunit CbiE [Palleronia abyssalis]SPJ23001.1 Precorrin-6Y C(5,15)-methyltransferase [decarboxylating] [Palleronia abyssalis]